MKKKFKWIIIAVVLIASYWLTQNMWIFQEKINITEYTKVLNGSEWKNKERKIMFFSDGTFETYKLGYAGFGKIGYGKKGSWEIDGDTIVVQSYTDLGEHTVNWNENWKIDILTKKTLHYSVIGPGNQKIKLHNH